MGATLKKEIILDYLRVTIGVVLIAFGLESFYIPNNIAAGGLSGFALVLNHHIPFLSVSNITLLFNIVLLIGAFKIIDKDFGFKTLYASFILTIFMNYFNYLYKGMGLTDDLILSVILGAFIMASGLFVLIKHNASTGGTEILARILSKYSNINISIALLCIDFFVTVLGGITFGLDKGIFAILAVLSVGVLLNSFMKINLIIRDKNIVKL
ncbi:MAG: YitT family protein [Clostridium perfringens]|nr:YitT family protein [Clostridium perfringens]